LRWVAEAKKRVPSLSANDNGSCLSAVVVVVGGGGGEEEGGGGTGGCSSGSTNRQWSTSRPVSPMPSTCPWPLRPASQSGKAPGSDEARRAAASAAAEGGEEPPGGNRPGGTSPDWDSPAATAFLERGLARGDTQWEAAEREAQDLTRASARRTGGPGEAGEGASGGDELGAAAAASTAASSGTETTSLSLAAPTTEQRGREASVGVGMGRRKNSVALEQTPSSDPLQLSAAAAAGAYAAGPPPPPPGAFGSSAGKETTRSIVGTRRSSPSPPENDEPER